MIEVLWLAGTGFGAAPDGVSLAFAEHLDPARFRFRAVPYPATYGGVDMPYAESRAIGRKALIDAIDRSPYPAVIGGYSQGAGIAGDLAAEIGRGLHPQLDVRACALVADPLRPRGDYGFYPGAWLSSGYGISGERHIFGLPTSWAANEGDPITALPAGNPLRSVADLTAWWSLRSPEDAERWAQDLLERAKRGAWQRWWSPENWRTWSGAIAYMRGYLFDGRHGLDYVRLGHCERLAMAINGAVQ
ncbi:PE-PPE domain-containing protein [Nocardia concava]|uniref:PE-PPE domain-containing protein n=1 Tax=Nocardia concava TaxID=257281 RepID=UPI0003137E13|nr:PE-PPE domain-containing protein [Nocardia concava]